MSRLILRRFDEEHEYDYDVKRIVRLCAERDLEIDKQTARRAWKLYSEDMAAGWMHLPEDDDNLISIILRYTEIVS